MLGDRRCDRVLRRRAATRLSHRKISIVRAVIRASTLVHDVGGIINGVWPSRHDIPGSLDIASICRVQGKERESWTIEFPERSTPTSSPAPERTPVVEILRMASVTAASVAIA